MSLPRRLKFHVLQLEVKISRIELVLGDESFHTAKLWLILPSAVLAFSMSRWQHEGLEVLALGILGLTGMVLAAMVLHDLFGEIEERIITVLTATILQAVDWVQILSPLDTPTKYGESHFSYTSELAANLLRCANAINKDSVKEWVL